jgi:GTP-binding protein Era
VRIDNFKGEGSGLVSIQATVIAGKESHKGILIGKGAAVIKRIGVDSRKEIEALLGEKVYLDLRVKIIRDWKKSGAKLKNLGYDA